MERHQELAWDCLTEQEMASLMFIQGKGLSTWEAGEILKMSHYKYLELNALGIQGDERKTIINQLQNRN